MKRPVPHQITLVAFSADEGSPDGFTIRDIVETSLHHASFFARGYYRDSEVVAIAALSPNASIRGLIPRKIQR